MTVNMCADSDEGLLRICLECVENVPPKLLAYVQNTGLRLGN